MGVAKSFLSLEVLVFRFRVHFSLAADAVRSPRFAYATEFPQFSRDIPTERFASSFPPCVSIMGCPFKELSTSALSASPRRLTEGVLEAEGPTSVEAGVASCLLLDTEPVFRRLRDDLWDIFDGMIGAVGTSWQSAPWECLLKTAGTP